MVWSVNNLRCGIAAPEKSPAESSHCDDSLFQLGGRITDFAHAAPIARGAT